MLHSSTTSLDLGTLEPKYLLSRIPDLNRNINVFLPPFTNKNKLFYSFIFLIKTISLVKTKANLILKLAVGFFDTFGIFKAPFGTFKAEYSKF